MWNLFVEVLRFAFFGIMPTPRGRDFLRMLTHTAYFLCPLLALLAMILLGLQAQWIGGYVIAAFFSIIPVILLELYRRATKVFPIVGDWLSEVISTFATPHTWLAIVCFWLILLEPSSRYRSLVYLVAFGAVLYIIVGGRWHHNPTWYRPLTIFSFWLPIVVAVVILILDAYDPYELVAFKNWLGIKKEDTVKARYGQRYDQNIGRVVESGMGYRLEERWFGKPHRIPVDILVNEFLWKTKGDHQLFPDGRYYAQYRRALQNRIAPNQDDVIWFPESQIAAAGSLETEQKKLAPNTPYYPDDNGVPYTRVAYMTIAYEAEVTNLTAYADGQKVRFARVHDRGRVYDIWLKI